MIKVSYLFIGVLLISAACNKPVEKQTPSGLKYSVVKAGTGAATKKDDILVFDFQMKDSKDSVWNDSYKDGMPAAIEVKDTAQTKQADGITQMLSELKVGDSVKTTMTMPEFFKGRPLPPGVDSASSITFFIKVQNIMTLDQFIKWREAKVKEKDEKQITEYLAKNKIDAKRDTSGLYYVLHNSTGEAKPTAESCVVVKYEGKFLKDGNPFDKNPKIAFSLNQVIRGWKLAIPMLGKGDSATFFVPSTLAYGPQGYYGIPPDAVLMFDVKLFDFKNTFDQATNSCK